MLGTSVTTNLQTAPCGRSGTYASCSIVFVCVDSAVNTVGASRRRGKIREFGEQPQELGAWGEHEEQGAYRDPAALGGWNITAQVCGIKSELRTMSASFRVGKWETKLGWLSPEPSHELARSQTLADMEGACIHCRNNPSQRDDQTEHDDITTHCNIPTTAAPTSTKIIISCLNINAVGT